MFYSPSIQFRDRGNSDSPTKTGVMRGKVVRHHVTGEPDLQYGLFVADRLRPGTPVFIPVHGIRRGFLSQARRFAPFVHAVGGILVAPLFHKRRFPDYQRLGRMGRGDRADLALKRIIADAARRTGLPLTDWVMFGYSGGGQFVHRFAMANPCRVKRVAIVAAGWYTFPDSAQPYPRGIAKTSTIPDATFDPARFLRIPTLVMVGEKDVVQDVHLRTGKKITAQQGANRLERGRRWIRAMSETAHRFGLQTTFTFETLPGCGHSFVECMKIGRMGRWVFDFLFPEGADNDASSDVHHDGKGCASDTRYVPIHKPCQAFGPSVECNA